MASAASRTSSATSASHATSSRRACSRWSRRASSSASSTRSSPSATSTGCSEAGKDLYPAIVALMRWGDRHLLKDEHGPPVVLHHNACGHDADPLLVCSHCHEELNPREVTPVRGEDFTAAEAFLARQRSPRDEPSVKTAPKWEPFTPQLLGGLHVSRVHPPPPHRGAAAVLSLAAAGTRGEAKGPALRRRAGVGPRAVRDHRPEPADPVQLQPAGSHQGHPRDHRAGRRRDARRASTSAPPPAISTASARTRSSTASTRARASPSPRRPAFTPLLNGRFFGVDFNPTVDKIRVTSDARLNLRLNVDEGTVLMQDADAEPGHAARRRLGLHELLVQRHPARRDDALRDRLGGRHDLAPEPAEHGTLTNLQRLRFDMQDQSGFDIAGTGQRRLHRHPHEPRLGPLHGRSGHRTQPLRRPHRRR